MLFNRSLFTGLLLVPAVLAAPGPVARSVRRNEQWRSGLNNPLDRNSASESNAFYSSNWAGPVWAKDVDTFISVTGTFKVPVPKGKQGDSASIWVGIDGDTCSSAILQTGITLTVGKNSSDHEYGAWYEWYPDYAITMTGIAISAGHEIRLTVTSTSNTSGIATVENLTNGQSNTTLVTSSVPLCKQNAEWIVEDYSLGFSMVPFANFGAVEFTNAWATLNDSSYLSPLGADMYNIFQNNKTLTNVTTDASTVKITYK